MAPDHIHCPGEKPDVEMNGAFFLHQGQEFDLRSFPNGMMCRPNEPCQLLILCVMHFSNGSNMLAGGDHQETWQWDERILVYYEILRLAYEVARNQHSAIADGTTYAINFPLLSKEVDGFHDFYV